MTATALALRLFLELLPRLLAPGETIPAARALESLDGIAVAAAARPLYAGADGVEATADLLTSIAYRESRLDPRAVNPKGGDSGLLQLRRLWWQGLEREAVLNPATNARLALDALHELRRFCGGPTELWLGAYASGACGRGLIAARARCGPVGLCLRK